MSLLKAGSGRLGDSRLVSLLGAGGMGEVYLAVSLTGDRVAVKVIHPHLVSDNMIRERFEAEVENLKMVFGSRVARLEDADPYGDPAWLAVEYVPGLTLKQYVERRGPLPVDLGAMVGAMLADGLYKVHQVGLLHRDLKPQNVILGPDGPVLIDFGLAVLTEREQELTESGVAVGTPAYMAPEQARGDRDLTAATDIYGLAATLVLALAGHPIYPQTKPLPLLQRITDPDDLPDLAGVPAELTPLLGTMLAFDPSARPDLATVRGYLLDVATAAGATHVEQLRRRVAQTTYDAATDITVPPQLADPLVDPENDTDETTPAPPHSEEAAAGVGGQEAEPEVPEAALVDVGWLVDKMRRQYSRRATL